MTRVLLVDDDLELCEMLAEYLTVEGFTVETAHDGEAGAARAAAQGGYDVVVLDVMLPRLNGFEALRRIRQSSAVPVLMLTAKGDEVDRIVGLEMGADDYLPKPCNPRELVARLRAILRRTAAEHGEGAGDMVLRAGGVSVRPAGRTAEWRGQSLDLTSTEYNLLEVLVREAGRVVTKAELSEQALGRQLARYDRSIDMHVSKLRRKLGAAPDGRSPIQTVRGVGYQLITE
ncbi:MAG: response regulator transcription factor [Gammaproteobacteria bacterium]